MARAAKKAKTEATPELVWTPAIKGFRSNLTCRDFQFAVGETYTHDGPIQACRRGFHAIIGHPLEVFAYYAPAGSRFFRVELAGEQHSDDQHKAAAQILKVGAEIGITDLVNDAIKWVLAHSHPEGEAATGDRGAASATGYQGAASATGDQGAASATGDRGAASATGDQGAASATGDRGAAMASGFGGMVQGAIGNALFACERETWNGPILSVASGIVGKDGIEPGAWYRCIGGKLVAQ